ncbi:twin-arginine translocase TatA/TatE family subunit [Microlunatus sp. Gsoil 973]|jgi:sec-independent protein translocase protein TatA|uniref:twin-arginine translocase TatA/TatE family subunit n=1 Tax=Microlunatus sp. Gsoil 973 TaxID=2672569 RepID=UPI00351B0E8F
MSPLAGFMNLGPTELIIILVIVLVLFGGARLAGLGKSTGRAIREFKEETKNLADKKDDSEVVDAEVVDPQPTEQTPPAVGGPQQQVQQPTNSAAQPSEARRDN